MVLPPCRGLQSLSCGAAAHAVDGRGTWWGHTSSSSAPIPRLTGISTLQRPRALAQCQGPGQEGKSNVLVQEPNTRLQAPLASAAAAWPDIIIHSFLHTHAKIPAKSHTVSFLAFGGCLLMCQTKPVAGRAATSCKDEGRGFPPSPHWWGHATWWAGDTWDLQF